MVYQINFPKIPDGAVSYHAKITYSNNAEESISGPVSRSNTRFRSGDDTFSLLFSFLGMDGGEIESYDVIGPKYAEEGFFSVVPV